MLFEIILCNPPRGALIIPRANLNLIYMQKRGTDTLHIPDSRPLELPIQKRYRYNQSTPNAWTVAISVLFVFWTFQGFEPQDRSTTLHFLQKIVCGLLDRPHREGPNFGTKQISPAKVRIREQKTKRKLVFFGFLERKYLRPKVRGTNKRGQNKINSHLFLLCRAKVPKTEGQRYE